MSLCSKERSTNQRLEAMQWYFGKRQCRQITLSETDSDFGDSFDLNIIDFNYAEQKLVIFLDDSVETAPSIAADQTLISVTVTSGDSANDKALAIELALATYLVRTEVLTDAIEIQNALVGAITIETTSVTPAIVIETQELGFGGYIGQTGESELTTTTEVVQLMDDAQGSVVQDEIIVGQSAEINLPLKEMSTERWESLIGNVTGSTVEINGKNITGWGTSKLYNSMFLYSGRLCGHPVRLPKTDITEDITMLNTAPKMNSLNFSGASIQEAEFVFTSYKDANAPEGINILARGDHSEF